ncbi:flagellar biosynthesis protein FlgA [Brucella pituitosa]|uniref:NAD(P)H-dependent oxidoreductase n=1 Tax=Brucella pituitosa TaxID=571256 RepID=UPI002005FDEC|nr:flagellar biosynthesis protein FlgA [Brucella pituitosa]MCK4207243.1 flagellar biosynthesis protein FlgA [Brucella pituitosa]
MNYHAYFDASHRPVETCILGTGGFGRSFLAQGLRVPLMRARVAVDICAEVAAKAIIETGISEENVRVCDTAKAARAAWDAGHYVAVNDFALVADLPLDVVVEATGHPEAGARHARLAIEAGHHVALVSKEVDSVVGPGLAAMAREKGLIVTPVDGDQPSLLIGLITWAQLLGFEILAAGKSSEYDFVFDAETGKLTSNGVSVDAPGFGDYSHFSGRNVEEVVAGRAKAASQLPQRAVPDLCELTVVANALGLTVDAPALHAPIARIGEVPSVLCLKSEGGVLQKTGTLDVFHCLRNPGEVSFAGGVFVIIRCDDVAIWKMLEEKGHVVSRDLNCAMVYIPRHLLGLEAATSVLEAGIKGLSSGAITPAHHVDLIAIADSDLKEGQMLEMGGHHHSITGVSSAILPARALVGDAPAPFYLASNKKLRRSVKAGQAITIADLEIPETSALWQLRLWQDAYFFGATDPHTK